MVFGWAVTCHCPLWYLYTCWSQLELMDRPEWSPPVTMTIIMIIILISNQVTHWGTGVKVIYAVHLLYTMKIQPRLLIGNFVGRQISFAYHRPDRWYDVYFFVDFRYNHWLPLVGFLWVLHHETVAMPDGQYFSMKGNRMVLSFLKAQRPFIIPCLVIFGLCLHANTEYSSTGLVVHSKISIEWVLRDRILHSATHSLSSASTADASTRSRCRVSGVALS